MRRGDNYLENCHVFAQDDWHLSIRAAEYFTDLMFRGQDILAPLYDAISRQAVLAADAARVAGFMGKKIAAHFAQEIDARLSTRIEGRCIEALAGPGRGEGLRQVLPRAARGDHLQRCSFFRHRRSVEHKGAAPTRELAPLKKSIYCLIDLREILLAATSVTWRSWPV
jgi:hypothetical protein